MSRAEKKIRIAAILESVANNINTHAATFESLSLKLEALKKDLIFAYPWPTDRHLQLRVIDKLNVQNDWLPVLREAATYGVLDQVEIDLKDNTIHITEPEENDHQDDGAERIA